MNEPATPESVCVPHECVDWVGHIRFDLGGQGYYGR